MKTRPATKRNRTFQLESLECRTVLSGGVHAALLTPSMPSGTSSSPTGLFGNTSPSNTSPTGSTTTGSGHTGGSTTTHTNTHQHQFQTNHHTTHSPGGQSAAHRQDAVHRLNAANMAIARTTFGLNAALSNLQRVEANAPAAASQGLNQAVTRIQHAASNLDHALTMLQNATASTTTGTTTGTTTTGTTTGTTTTGTTAPGLSTAKASLKNALADIKLLQGKIPAARLTAIENVLTDALSRIPSSTGSKV